MKHRLLDWLLILALIVGGILAWKTGRERSRLEERRARLARMTGDLPIADASKVHLRAIDTGERRHFAWRVYLPPNYKHRVSYRAGGSSTSSSSGPSEFIARVRFREDEQGLIQVYTHFGGGSSRMGIGDKALAELLRGRWDRVRIEQIGAPEVAVFGPDQTAVLLRLTLHDDLEAEARKRLDGYVREQFVPVLFEMVLGPETSGP
jgi:hypothetical protein